MTEPGTISFLDSYGNEGPVFKIPIEVLAQIFDDCIPYTSSPYHSLDIKIAPWTLSYVCKHWRKIALWTPSLWSHISLERPGRFKVHHKRGEVSLIRLSLERAKGYPLHIRIMDNTMEGLRLNNEVTSQILARSNQWKTFQYYASSWADLGPLESLRGQFTLLETLDLKMITARGLLRRGLTAFGDAPRLKTAIIQCSVKTLKVALPFGQLEHYETAKGSDDVSELSKCPLLRTYVQGYLRSLRPYTSTAAIRHDRLTCLQVGSSEELKFLDLPSLRSLTVAISKRDVFQECANFVGTSNCLLSYCRLGYLRHIERTHVEGFLRLVPQLDGLNLAFQNTEFKLEAIEAILGLLTISPESTPSIVDGAYTQLTTTPLVPMLETFDLQFFRTNVQFDHNGLLAMLESRYHIGSNKDDRAAAPAVGRLRRVKIVTSEVAGSFDVQGYRDLIKAGLELSFEEFSYDSLLSNIELPVGLFDALAG